MISKTKRKQDDDDEKESKDDFGSSLVSDIDVKKTKMVRAVTPDPTPSNRKYDLQMKSKAASGTSSTSVSTSKDLASVNRPSKDFRSNLMSGRQRSGTLHKSCETVTNNMDTDNTITVKFFHAWDKYFTSEAFNDVVKGFKITSINENVFGNEFKDTGVEAGWQLIKIGKRKVATKNYTVIRGDLEKNSKFGGKGGYMVTFLCVEAEKEDEKDTSEKKSENNKAEVAKKEEKKEVNTKNVKNSSPSKSPVKTPIKTVPNPAKRGMDKYDRSLVFLLAFCVSSLACTFFETVLFFFCFFALSSVFSLICV